MSSASTNVSPHVYVASTLITAIASIVVFDRVGFEGGWFVAPVVALAIIYAAINFWRQKNGPSDYRVLKDIRWSLLVKKAFARYVVWLAILSFGSILFRNLPYYSRSNFAPNFTFFFHFLNVYLILGLPYFVGADAYRFGSDLCFVELMRVIQHRVQTAAMHIATDALDDLLGR